MHMRVSLVGARARTGIYRTYILNICNVVDSIYGKSAIIQPVLIHNKIIIRIIHNTHTFPGVLTII